MQMQWRTGMRLAAIALLLFLMVNAPANAQLSVFWNFTQWQQKSYPERVGYIAGAIDSLVILATTAEQQQHSLGISNCLRNSRMTTGQLVQNVTQFGQQNPDVQAQPVQLALVRYLNALCGL